MKEPDLLLADECTSHLDKQNQDIIMNNLSNYLKNKTGIFIVHDLNIIKNFDEEVKKYCYMWREGGQFSTKKYSSDNIDIKSN